MRHVQVDNLRAPQPADAAWSGLRQCSRQTATAQGHLARPEAGTQSQSFVIVMHALKCMCQVLVQKEPSDAWPARLPKTTCGQSTQTVLRLAYVYLERTAVQATCGGCVKPSKKPCAPQSGTHAGTQTEIGSTACIAHRYQLGLLYSATQGRERGTQGGFRGTKKQERPCTPVCQRCTGHIGVQAPASAMAG